jgi:predicted acyl esterase
MTTHRTPRSTSGSRPRPPGHGPAIRGSGVNRDKPRGCTPRRGGLAALLALAALASTLPAAARDRTTVNIPMRDGHALAADVYLPSGSGPWPTILIQTPYNRLQFVPALALSFPDPLFGDTDYAFVVTDWRGYFGSAGAAVPGYDRGLDGYDTVEWIAAQPWSDGDVGTWGASALGVIQFETASKHPPHLRAAVPMVSHIADSYELYYPGGVWARNKNAFVEEHFGLPGVANHPLEDGFWSLVDAAAIQPDAIDVPMLHVSGWYDHETTQSLAAAGAIQSGGGPGARGRQWVLVGPWSHSGLGDLQQGDLTYPAAVDEPARLAVLFFDYYLRGVDNGWTAREPYRTFLINADSWRDASAWPPPVPGPAKLFLTAGGALSPTPPPSDAPPRGYTSDPADPVPTLFGGILIQTNATQGPGDLRPVEARPDMLTYTTPPFDSPLQVEGTVTAHLVVACSAVDTDMAVRLTDVWPDGRSELLVDGIRRVSLRASLASRQFLSPETPYEVDVTIPPVAVLFPPGHSLRVLVASTNYDRFDVNVQDGSSLSDDSGAHPVTADVQILSGAAHPSWIALPVVNERPTRRHLQRLR